MKPHPMVESGRARLKAKRIRLALIKRRDMKRRRDMGDAEEADVALELVEVIE